MKRTFAYLLALALLLTALLPVNAAAETNQSTAGPVSGTCGENATWVFEDGVLTISGTGTAINENRTLPGSLVIKELVVESGIVAIADEFCYAWFALEKVTLADTVESLGVWCFHTCPKLKEVNLSSGLRYIGIGCFSGSVIEEITIPEGVEHIDEGAFEFCTELKSVTLPDSIREIGFRCFYQCYHLVSVKLSKGLDTIPYGTFQFDPLAEMEIPEGVKELHTHAFSDCTELKKITIPPSVSQMQDCGLDTCDQVTIYCWENTAAHFYALEMGIPYVLMEEPAEMDVYDLMLLSNDLGTATISTLRTTAGSPVLLKAIPALDSVKAFIGIYYDSEEELDLHVEKISDTKLQFQMPPCEVAVEVVFLDMYHSFRDIMEFDYFYLPVVWANALGITSGVDENHFAPKDACTRGQVVTFLWRAAGEPKPESGENPFWDVRPGDYYYDAVLWAVENGITNGVRPGEFAPYDSCTRGQIVTFLWRAVGSPEPMSQDHPFVDMDTSQYYYNPVLWAVEYGVTNGTTETTFSPDDTCTRGQIVTFLWRASGSPTPLSMHVAS